MNIKSSWPKISIVTPSYNQADFLETTIQSILSQNYPNLEYIIIDGGSTDGSVEIIKKYESHLHFWCSEPDNGQYDAINKGFAQTSGEILAWLNSDDVYFPWTLKTVASIMTELPEVQWLTSLNLCVVDYQGISFRFHAMPGYSKDAFLDGGYVPWDANAMGWLQQESTFWTRSLWNASGAALSPKLRLAGDFELWARFFQHAELYTTFSPLSSFRMQEAQRSRQQADYLREVRHVLETMRTQCAWSPQRMRALLKAFKIFKFPKLRTLFRPLYSYTGKRIYRDQEETTSACWRVEEYPFFHY
ncbi:glycosyl transferase [candidate division KSB3 bacterium]|uniref:Glycosyl transferase n=1 Tax=candidate division KSB3 bacterium TaxID=2044937 RepID=A0A2G6K969_9BACT|nr:MAG: glycosyl transferase [candidate division KSB3 bacterium]